MAKPHVEYSEELAQEICETIASNGKGLQQLCKLNQHWPNRRTIFRWLLKYPSFKTSYTRAKVEQIESFIDEIIEISDDSENDTIVTEDGKKISNQEWMSRSRLRVDTRKWLASKLMPKLYGDSSKNNDSSGDKSALEKIIDES